MPVATSFTLSMTLAVLVLAFRPAARSFVVADFTFFVMALRLAATFRFMEDAVRFILLIADARLPPPLRAADLAPPRLAPPRFAPPREDFFADRFALAITSPCGLMGRCVLANSLSFSSNTTKVMTGFISGCLRAVKWWLHGRF